MPHTASTGLEERMHIRSFSFIVLFQNANHNDVGQFEQNDWKMDAHWIYSRTLSSVLVSTFKLLRHLKGLASEMIRPLWH